jgi:hypothetical protein
MAGDSEQGIAVPLLGHGLLLSTFPPRDIHFKMHSSQIHISSLALALLF